MMKTAHVCFESRASSASVSRSWAFLLGLKTVEGSAEPWFAVRSVALRECCAIERSEADIVG